MRNCVLLLACIAAAIAVAVKVGDPDHTDGPIDVRRNAVSSSPGAIADAPEPHPMAIESKPLTREEPGSVRRVPAFDNAFSVRVHVFDMLDAITPLREGPIADYFGALAQSANAGDARAAYELGFVLYRCVGYATTAQELSDKVDTMSQTHLLQGPYYPQPQLTDDVHTFIEIERERYRDCKGLSNEQITGYYDWFVLAAELGDYIARSQAIELTRDHYLLSQGLAPDIRDFDDAVGIMNRIASAEPERLQQAAQHLFAARAQGSLQALHDLALLYAAGIMNAPNEHSATANAYANLRAAFEVWRSLRSPGSYDYGEDLRQLANSLSPYERNWAEVRAQSILLEKTCCRDP